MAKGDSKVSKSKDDISDSDNGYTPPSYEELASLVKEYTKIIIKSNEKIDKLKLDKKNLVTKCNEHEAKCLELEKKNVELKGIHDDLDKDYTKLKKEFQ